MMTADIVENDLIKMIEEFSIFERNKIRFRRIALLLDVGKSTVHYWIDRFKDILDSERKEEEACNTSNCC